ncbi:hypothetical protein LTR10_011043 [Elasticomyces elasticus]|nr:hypothetical protein LTR10_011043 [Elasticomyces elasticus]KAK4968646.1 hypothetical protein LTR42_009929 [Elasticomyces elasticus]
MATRPNKLANKHIVVFGGTSGIGFAVAEAILASSPTASLTISSSSSTKIEATTKRLLQSFPSNAIAGHVCNLATPDFEDSISSLFSAIGKVDHIIVTAGDPISRASVYDSTLDSIRAAGQVRFIAPILIAKHGSKYLTPGPESSIIFTGAMVGQRPMEGWAVVAGYAAGIEGVTRNLAVDLKPVRVNCVAPGPVDTELVAGMSDEQRRLVVIQLQAQILQTDIQRGFYAVAAKTPIGRAGRPEDVAEAYLWLMKDSNVTGFVACSDAGAKLSG